MIFFSFFTQDGDIEFDCLVKVDDCGFFIYWKSEQRVGYDTFHIIFYDNGTMLLHSTLYCDSHRLLLLMCMFV